MTRVGVHGPLTHGDRRSRLDGPPDSAGPFRLFVAFMGHAFLPGTGFTADERYEQEQRYGQELDQAFATREEALAIWAKHRSFQDHGIGHVFGILVELADDDDKGTAEWLP